MVKAGFVRAGLRFARTRHNFYEMRRDNRMSLPRRSFLGSIGAAAAVCGVAARPAFAIDPIKRGGAARLKLSLAAYSFRESLAGPKKNMTLDDFVDLCAEFDIDAVEPTSYFFPDPVTPAYCRALRKRAFLHGLSISGTAIRNTFTYAPGPALDKEMAHVKKWCDYAAELGAPVIRIFAGNLQPNTKEVDARRWCIDAIEQCCEYAGRRGVILALENHGGIVTRADQLISIAREIRSEWFGVNWDSGNFRGSDPYAELAQAAPYAVTAQIKTEVMPNDGPKVEADLARVVDILRKANYRGFVALEYEAKEDAKTAVPRYLQQLRKLMG